jgi:hypothetical protein
MGLCLSCLKTCRNGVASLVSQNLSQWCCASHVSEFVTMVLFLSYIQNLSQWDCASPILKLVAMGLHLSYLQNLLQWGCTSRIFETCRNDSGPLVYWNLSQWGCTSHVLELVEFVLSKLTRQTCQEGHQVCWPIYVGYITTYCYWFF